MNFSLWKNPPRSWNLYLTDYAGQKTITVNDKLARVGDISHKLQTRCETLVWLFPLTTVIIHVGLVLCRFHSFSQMHNFMCVNCVSPTKVAASGRILKACPKPTCLELRQSLGSVGEKADKNTRFFISSLSLVVLMDEHSDRIMISGRISPYQSF